MKKMLLIALIISITLYINSYKILIVLMIKMLKLLLEMK